MSRSEGRPATMAQVVDDDDGGPLPGGGAMELVGQGRVLRRTQTQYTGAIAVAKERDMKKLQQICLYEAGQMGEAFFYAWTQKDKNATSGKGLIKGISIDGAMVLARNWGNCTVEIDIAEESPAYWILRATFIDFETGYVLPRLHRQRKSESHGNYDSERLLDIALAIGQSKAQRNAVAKALPAWLIDMCMDQATTSDEIKYAVVDGSGKPVKGPDGYPQVRPEKVKQMVERFATIAVTVPMLEKKLERTINTWEPRDLVVLAAIGRAIKDRITTVAQEFADEPKPAETAPVQANADGVVTPPASAVAADAVAPTQPAPVAATSTAPAVEPKTEPAKAEAKPEEPKGEPGKQTKLIDERPAWAGPGKKP